MLNKTMTKFQKIALKSIDQMTTKEYAYYSQIYTLMELHNMTERMAIQCAKNMGETWDKETCKGNETETK